MKCSGRRDNRLERNCTRPRERERDRGEAGCCMQEKNRVQMTTIIYNKILFKVNAAIKVKQANWGNGDGPTGRVINLLRPSPIC